MRIPRMRELKKNKVRYLTINRDNCSIVSMLKNIVSFKFQLLHLPFKSLTVVFISIFFLYFFI